MVACGSMLGTVTRFAIGFAIGYVIAYCFTTLINQEAYKMEEHGDEHLTWEDETPELYNYELAEILADYKRDQEGER